MGRTCKGPKRKFLTRKTYLVTGSHGTSIVVAKSKDDATSIVTEFGHTVESVVRCR